MKQGKLNRVSDYHNNMCKFTQMKIRAYVQWIVLRDDKYIKKIKLLPKRKQMTIM